MKKLLVIQCSCMDGRHFRFISRSESREAMAAILADLYKADADRLRCGLTIIDREKSDAVTGKYIADLPSIDNPYNRDYGMAGTITVRPARFLDFVSALNERLHERRIQKQEMAEL